MLSLRNIEWVAGFLEGEGAFQCGGPRGSTPVVSVMQVQREPLERLQKMFGGEIRMWLRKHKNPKHNDASRWQACGGKAAGLMMMLYPLMSPKRKEQITKALVAWRVAKGEAHNSLKTHCHAGHEFTAENTYRRPAFPNQRYCRACTVQRNAKAYQAKKAVQ